MYRPDPNQRPPLSRLEIDLAALHRNAAAIRELIGEGPVLCAAVKKNAYGLGAVPITHRLVKAGCGMIAVYAPEEAEQLIAGAVTAPLLLLYPLRRLNRTDPLYRPAVADRLHLSVHDPSQLDALEQVGHTFGLRLPVHLYLDTGMSRSGLSPAEFVQVLDSLGQRKYLRVAGVMTHLATADNDPDFAQAQVQRFDALLEEHAARLPPDATIHLANTYATLRSGHNHRAMVRCGLGLYGYGPSDLAAGPQIDPALALEPVLRWVSRVIHVQRYAKGAVVGYGATHRLQNNTTVGIVPVGYGDGYPLALSDRAVVRLRLDEAWHDCRVLGRANMDQLTIDLSDVPNASSDHPSGLFNAEIEIYSNDPQAPNAVDKLARLAASHVYELLCRLSPAIPRQYIQ